MNPQIHHLMRKPTFLIAILICMVSCTTSKSTFKLSSTENIPTLGETLTRDITYNPYNMNEKSIAIVKNVGKNYFMVRIRNQGKITQNITVDFKETEEIVLTKGDQLYLDSYEDAKASVKFKAYKPK